MRFTSGQTELLAYLRELMGKTTSNFNHTLRLVFAHLIQQISIMLAGKRQGKIENPLATRVSQGFV